MNPENLYVAFFQYDIVWENKPANLKKIKEQLVLLEGTTDLLVLPEMFTTGFSMNASELAETNTGETISTVKEWAGLFGMAMAGSFIARENSKFYNRAFFITPAQEVYFYDKHHLFSIGTENHIFSAGNERTIVPYKGWNICLQICYDLRFPVWSRNRNNEYDLLLYMANWPASRISSWNHLLPARAVENLAYVCGVNRVGKDGMDLNYNGFSSVYDMKGELLGSLSPFEEGCVSVEISLEQLHEFRKKFPVWKDADSFEIIG
jgi:predicted amidohydrolase